MSPNRRNANGAKQLLALLSTTHLSGRWPLVKTLTLCYILLIVGVSVNNVLFLLIEALEEILLVIWEAALFPLMSSTFSNISRRIFSLGNNKTLFSFGECCSVKILCFAENISFKKYRDWFQNCFWIGTYLSWHLDFIYYINLLSYAHVFT